jgi:lipid-binding SYLF domain-containing protein
MRSSSWKFLVLSLVVAVVAPLAARADASLADAEKEVAASGRTLGAFFADKDLVWLREHATDTRGILVCSQVMKAGFIFGGSGGRCVLVTRGEKGWNGPAFYTVGTASAGFQAGIQSSEIVALVMTQKAVDSFMSNAFKVGGDASAAGGPVGVGTGATPNADLVYYSKAKGLYGGVDVSGGVFKPSEEYNKAYYGKDVSPIDILVKGSVHNKHAYPALISKIPGSRPAGAPGKASGTAHCKFDSPTPVAIGDTEGHAFATGKGECTWSNFEIAGVPLKDGVSVSNDEISGDKSTSHGYHTATLANGDKTTVRFQGTSTMKDGKFASGSGTWTFASGTGKFKGIKGKGTYKGTPNADGTVTYQVDGAYTLPK